MASRIRNLRRGFSFAMFLIFAMPKLLFANDPRNSARYDTLAENMFWFIQVTDTHLNDNTQESKLRWLLNTGVDVINPKIAVVTGDLTNGTGLLGPIYFTQQEDEWLKYGSVTVNQNSSTSMYFDVPGNHDRYGDPGWSYYRTYSVLGKRIAFDSTNPVGQFSKTVTLPSGDSYLFIGVNTCDSTGDKWIAPGGFKSDDPELSAAERDYIEKELKNFYPRTNPIPQNKLSFIFGHAGIYRLVPWSLNPFSEYTLNELGDADQGRGGPEFVSLLNQYNVSAYIFGHTHTNRDLYDLNSKHGISSKLINTASLAYEDTYRIIVVDNGGVVTRAFKLNNWPIAMITSPLNVKATGFDASYDTKAINNKYAYNLYSNPDNFIRVVAFDPSTSLTLTYNYKPVDSTSFILPTWANMNKVNDTSDIYQSGWDCSGLTEGEYNLVVKATSSNGECYDTITVRIDTKGLAFTSPNSGEILSGTISLKATINEDVFYDTAGIPNVSMAEMYYSTTGVSDWQKIGSTIIAPTERFIEIPFNSRQNFDSTTIDLYFKVKATFSNGISTEDPIDTCAIIDNICPTIPTNFTVQSVGDGKISLSWNSSSDINLAGYKIYRAEDAELNTITTA